MIDDKKDSPLVIVAKLTFWKKKEKEEKQWQTMAMLTSTGK